MDTWWYPTTLQDPAELSHGPPRHPPAPTSHFVLGYPPMLLAGPGIGAASTGTATSPASPSARTTKSQFQRPTSHLCSGPAAAASGKKRPASCDRRTQGTGKTGRGGIGGGGGALRPRTHFIPSHLYWISRISELRELVYPIRLHCKGRLPASSLSARGHGMLCGMGTGTRLEGGGSERHHLVPASQQPPPNPHHCRGAAGSNGGPKWVPLRSHPAPCKQLALVAFAQGANLVPNCAEDGGTGSNPPPPQTMAGGLCELPISPKTVLKTVPSSGPSLGEWEMAGSLCKAIP